jgi:uncharacterized membrane protein YuzA (DUF378 family)
MKWLNLVTLALVIVGGLNWGLVALNGYDADLVANLFGGPGTAGARVVYALVGLSMLWQLIPLIRSFRVGEVGAQAHGGRASTTTR